MFFTKYRLYKRLLQSFLFMNIGLIAVGLVASIRYFRESQIKDLEMAFIGFMLLVFGFLLPLLLLRKIEKEFKEWEVRTQKLMSDWLVTWINAQEAHGSNEEVIKDVGFWLNIAIIGMKSMQGQIRNPYFQFTTEMASFVRDALEQQRSNSTKKKKSTK